MEKSSGLGDQQAISERLAWLAGIMDGEGSFIIMKQKRGVTDIGLGRNRRRHGGKSGFTYFPWITLTNTDSAIINEADKICRSIGVVPHLYEETRPSENQKNTFRLHLSHKMQPCITIARALMPYLVGKRAQAELLIRFCETKIKYGHESPELDEIHAAMREKNRFGKSSQTMSGAPASAG
jgi:hypothetical protein